MTTGTLPSTIASSTGTSSFGSTTLTTSTGGTTLGSGVVLTNNAGITVIDADGIAGSGSIVNSAGAVFDVEASIAIAAFDNASGATLTVSAGTGGISGGGTTVAFNTALTNEGTLDVTAGITELGSGGSSSGSIIVAPGATLEFGVYSTGGLGGGGATQESYAISGTYQSSGTTAIGQGATVTFSGGSVNVGTGTWEVGTVGFSGGSTAVLDLSGATVTGAFNDLSMPGTLILGAHSVTIDGFELSGTLSDSATVTLTGAPGQAQLGGTLTGGHGTVVLSSGHSYTMSGGLTLDDSETLENAGTLVVSAAGITGATGAVVNDASGTLTFAGSSAITVAGLTNAGLLDVQSGTVAVAAAITDTAGGTIAVSSGATLDLSSATFASPLYDLDVAGTLNLGGNAVIVGAFDLTGTLSDTATVTLFGSSGSADLGGTLSGGGGTVALASGEIFSIASSLTLNGGKTLDNFGTLLVSAASIGSDTNAGDTIKNEANAAMHFDGGSTAVKVASFDNAGIVVLSGGTSVTLNAPVTNTGTIDVAPDAILALQQAVSGFGTLEIDSGSVLRLSAGASAGTVVTFTGSGGALYLGAPASFAAAISGFAQGDTIDLAGIAATTATYSGGYLTVADNGTQVASLALEGDFSSSEFTVSPDGAGGSDIAVTHANGPTNDGEYIGAIAFAQSFTDGGTTFEVMLEARIEITYDTPMSSQGPIGTVSWTTEAVATVLSGSGAGSSGSASGGLSQTSLPPAFVRDYIPNSNGIIMTTGGGSSGTSITADQVTLSFTTGSATPGVLTGMISEQPFASDTGNLTTATTTINLVHFTAPYDFSGDGDADILLRNSSTGQVSLWEMNGDLNSGGGPVTTTLGTQWNVAGIGDFNADGMNDILWQNTSTGQLGLWEMNGNSDIGGGPIAAPPAPWTIAAIGDFNEDGMADILWRNTATGAASIWEMDGNTNIGGGPISAPPPSWQVVGVGDFYGDTHTDILWQNSDTGQLSIWEMNGTSNIGGGPVAAPGAPWKIVGLGDFNGDGTTDILWQNSDTGQLGLWEMNGTTVIGGGPIAAPGAPWQVAGVGDYNGDGKADILWQNTSTGQLSIWEMNGTTNIGGGAVSTLPTTWQAVQNPTLAA
jgi:FG-GAP-like repeat